MHIRTLCIRTPGSCDVTGEREWSWVELQQGNYAGDGRRSRILRENIRQVQQKSQRASLLLPDWSRGW